MLIMNENIMKILEKVFVLILAILLIQSCTFVKQPDKYPLIVTEIYKSEDGYNIYVIKDSNPDTQGWGDAAMYIELKDKSHKFQIGDTIVFNKK